MFEYFRYNGADRYTTKVIYTVTVLPLYITTKYFPVSAQYKTG